LVEVELERVVLHVV